jgi:hypothetical protein
MECEPMDEADAFHGDRAEFEIAVHGVHGKLMLDKKVRNERRVSPATRSPAGNLDHLRAFGRNRIERLAPAARTEKEPAQKSRAMQGEKPCVDPGLRMESRGAHELASIRDAHQGEFAEKVKVAGLHDETALVRVRSVVHSVIPSHGAPRWLIS